ncbi:MAG: polymer-forming cytoskeletal protein, partial [Bacteroidales bacterium]
MAKHESVPQVNEVSRIATGTEIKGTLISQTDIRIDGSFEGDLITSGKLVLGENAVIKGNIICLSADIWGKLEGEFTVGDAVTFKSSSSFTGNLKTVRICIE